MLFACLVASLVCLNSASKVPLLALRARAAAIKTEANLTQEDTPEFKHRLRVCNAYPYDAAIDIHLGKKKVTEDKPLPYRTCENFLTGLKVHDRLDFKIGDAKTGTFTVSDLPGTDAVLLLVVFRHDVQSTAVSFESHIFEDNVEEAQIAIIDTYTGPTDSQPKISDGHSTESLHFGTVVAVRPGSYQVSLVNSAHQKKVEAALKVEEKVSYVVIRVGIDAHDGPSFPEELVMFPHQEDASHQLLPQGHSSAGKATLGGFAM
eukprot:CAMPEP_0197655446 /NCGR_PEP_ID=MMETSP1338-20131121/39459_1 /TAXON_ID=43686 ORGANISM="Pelagodinium beii, Strain RCC1491" /NCGR_SAMPLE_ID=MMETSP1338 /ASSEMBLY_ACC=CAM_ASM_000754 /LENGTH=261 /DNA_ID=CAMNT_0043231095 /DNA_START=42 /DNA_END=824 /DNA_ORIENTATION=-